MNKRTIQQNFNRIQSLLHVFVKNIIRKIKIMDIYEKLFVFGLFSSVFLLLFTPLFSISPNDVIENGLQYIFLSTSFVFIKTFLIILWSLILVWFFIFHLRFKTYMIETLWFQGNPYLIHFLFLSIALSGFIVMGEMTNLLSTYTTILKLTAFYYIIQIILILMLGLSLYMIVNKKQRHYKGHIVGYHGKHSQNQDNNSAGLFDNIRHTEE